MKINIKKTYSKLKADFGPSLKAGAQLGVVIGTAVIITAVAGKVVKK